MPITDAYIDEIKRKIDEKGNGEIDRMELALLVGIYQKVERIEKDNRTNPMHKIGEAMRENKGFTFLLGLIIWILVILFPQMLVSLMGIDHIVAP